MVSVVEGSASVVGPSSHDISIGMLECCQTVPNLRIEFSAVRTSDSLHSTPGQGSSYSYSWSGQEATVLNLY